MSELAADYKAIRESDWELAKAFSISVSDDLPKRYQILRRELIDSACLLASALRRLKETEEALVAAETRENDLIDRIRGKGGL